MDDQSKQPYNFETQPPAFEGHTRESQSVEPPSANQVPVPGASQTLTLPVEQSVITPVEGQPDATLGQIQPGFMGPIMGEQPIAAVNVDQPMPEQQLTVEHAAAAVDVDQPVDMEHKDIIERISLLKRPARARAYIDEFDIKKDTTWLTKAQEEIDDGLYIELGQQIQEAKASGIDAVKAIEFPDKGETEQSLYSDMARCYASVGDVDKALEVASKLKFAHISDKSSDDYEDYFDPTKPRISLFIDVASITNDPEAYLRAKEEIDIENEKRMTFKYSYLGSGEWRDIRQQIFPDRTNKYAASLDTELAMLSVSLARNGNNAEALQHAEEISKLEVRHEAFSKLVELGGGEYVQNEMSILNILMCLYHNEIDTEFGKQTLGRNVGGAFELWAASNDFVKGATAKDLDAALGIYSGGSRSKRKVNKVAKKTSQEESRTQPSNFD